MLIYLEKKLKIYTHLIVIGEKMQYQCGPFVDYQERGKTV